MPSGLWAPGPQVSAMRLVGRRRNKNDATLQVAADGVLRGPAARGLIADRVGDETNESDMYAALWLDAVGAAEKMPSTRVSVLRLAPQGSVEPCCGWGAFDLAFGS